MRGGGIPIRSLLGNKITSLFFHLTEGVFCPDTQTGLRGIPQNLKELALSVEGSRYEYEMNFLMDAIHLVPVEYVKIKTVYDNNNQESHFRPIVDSFRVYGRFLRFLLSSLTGFAVDYILFWILVSSIQDLSKNQVIFLATGFARIGSGTVNFIMNKYWSFQSNMPTGKELIRYATLFIAQMVVSASLVSIVSMTFIPILLGKVIVDVILFFLSYRIQKKWVFIKND